MKSRTFSKKPQTNFIRNRYQVTLRDEKILHFQEEI